MPTATAGLTRLTLVLDGETPVQLQARLREQEQTVAAIVAAPVRYLPQAFLDAVNGLFPQDDVEVGGETPRLIASR